MDKKLFEKAVKALAKETGKTLEESRQLLLNTVDALKGGQIVTTQK